IDRGRYDFTPRGRGAQTTTVRAFSDIEVDHIQNFLDCVKSRKLPNGDVLIGHRSAQASHLGNISYMQKRRIDFDPVREEILPF
ncbi:MAG: gfo/Idh/MocA family oxidoreductase, partial [Acidobacteriota bacterium]|nr:gfo/Idh/MocA family oxidoreductase [Acidobacteriota bacterium]